MGIVQSLFSRKGSDRKESDKEPAVAALPVKPAPANLMILMPDAAGIAAYQQHAFVAASGAEAYLGSIFSGNTQEGAIMFWGLTWRPSDNGHQDVEAEPVILIRDPGRPGLVYTFSFVDLDSAYDFVRHEMKAGLDLNQTAIFWAVPAEATANQWGEITVTPSKPPTRLPAANGGAPLSPPTPLVAPDHDEPQAADAPETVSEPEAAEEPAHKAIDDADISNVIDIVQAKGLRAASHSPQPADEPSDAGNGLANVGPETVHVNLGDVFGGRRDPETLTTLSDFRRSPEGPATNGLHAADDPIDAADKATSGIVAAWSNISAAIEGAIDAHVARRVSATIAWRNAARALRQAAESESGLRARRLAWANISWTLEEAVYAARLQRKKTVARAWRVVSIEMLVAAEMQAKAAAVHKGKGRTARVSMGTKTAMKATMKATKTTKKLAKGRSKAKDAPKTVAKGRSEAKDAPKKVAKGGSEAKAAPKNVAKGRSKAEDPPKPVAEMRSPADERAAAIELWRSRESGRFTARKDPFESFDSPPGRF